MDFGAPASGDGKTFRVLQFTPPGSEGSIIFGQEVTAAAPGSAQGLYLVVPTSMAARRPRSTVASPSVRCSTAPARSAGPTSPPCFGRVHVSRAKHEHGSYRSLAFVAQMWATTARHSRRSRRAGADRIDSTATTFASANDLASAFRRAEGTARRTKEAGLAQRDEDWPPPYAAYMVAGPVRLCTSDQLRGHGRTIPGRLMRSIF